MQPRSGVKRGVLGLLSCLGIAYDGLDEGVMGVCMGTLSLLVLALIRRVGRESVGEQAVSLQGERQEGETVSEWG